MKSSVSVLAAVALAAVTSVVYAPVAHAACPKTIETSSYYTNTKSSGCGTQAPIKKVVNGAIVTVDGNQVSTGKWSYASHSGGYLYGNYARWLDDGWTAWQTL
jgi:hypothetical protein